MIHDLAFPYCRKASFLQYGREVSVLWYKKKRGIRQKNVKIFSICKSICQRRVSNDAFDEPLVIPQEKRYLRGHFLVV